MVPDMIKPSAGEPPGSPPTSSLLPKPSEVFSSSSPPSAGAEENDDSNLSWLVNLSAASLFSSENGHAQQTSKCPSNPLRTPYVEYDQTNAKPALTYTELIEKALKEKGELTVSDIYKYIYSKYPYYKKNDGRWKNSIRHNLSINPHFRKGEKCNNGGHFWTLNKEYDEEFKKWEIRKGMKDEKKKKRKDEDELEIATRSIMLEAVDETAIEPGSADVCLANNGDVVTAEATAYITSCEDVEAATAAAYISSNEDPTLLRVATNILNGNIEGKVAVEYMERTSGEEKWPNDISTEHCRLPAARKSVDLLSELEKHVEDSFPDGLDSHSAPMVIEEDIFETSDQILSDPVLFSDCLELGFQPYELIDPRL
ncbi:Hypothetical protein NTJ_03969 [Nesidiocoris tenuis]|uniref:Fork-head domain-containing protein n=1 Tax=Nesidiocoris tenuis TaxID=355587 RepID=A0ABN7AFY6_9HEMI|nr:Hypothetical protein NTJ_03969 [Nesidiocoris tenuis]